MLGRSSAEKMYKRYGEEFKVKLGKGGHRKRGQVAREMGRATGLLKLTLHLAHL